MPIPSSLVLIILGIISLIVCYIQNKKHNKFTRIYLFLGIIFILLGLIPGILLSLQNNDFIDENACEKLSEVECIKHQDACSLCGETIASSFAACHSRAYCQSRMHKFEENDAVLTPGGKKAAQIASDLTDVASITMQLGDWDVVDAVAGFGSREAKEEQEVFEDRDQAITAYLLRQSEFAWQTEEDSKNACVFEDLDEDNILFPRPLWVLCQEYVIENKDVKILSGVSLPVLVDYPNELSFFDINRFSHKTPRDGSHYSPDIKVIFDENVRDKIFDFQTTNGLSDSFKKKVQI
jgi:hypothetical protein